MINSDRRKAASDALEQSALVAAKELMCILVNTDYFNAPNAPNAPDASANRFGCLTEAMNAYPALIRFDAIKAGHFDRFIVEMCATMLKEVEQGRLVGRNERIEFVGAFSAESVE